MHISKEHIGALASKAGFDACGIAPVGFLAEDAGHLKEYLDKGWQGEMGYMQNHFDKRCNPALLVDGAKSIIVLLHNYYPPDYPDTENNYKIARYALGEDYHHVIKAKMHRLAEMISKETGSFHYRCFTDSAPVLERSLAVKAGLGGIGKSGNFIVPGKGSYFIISEIISNLEIEADKPFTRDLCGKCTRCMDACPTAAIVEARKLDARKCISYLSIELRGEIPEEFRGKTEGNIFGCDICQEVCPHNRHARPHKEEKLMPREELLSMNKEKWQQLSPEGFRRMFRKSAVKRTKYEGLMRNIRFLK